MELRMIGKHAEILYKMLKLLPQRKGWKETPDMTKFYIGQRLMWMIREGNISDKELERFVLGDGFSKLENPVYWYHREDADYDWQHKLIVDEFRFLSDMSCNNDCRVSQSTLDMIQEQTLYWRIKRYLKPEDFMNEKILCIVGKSGTGKTTASLHLQKKFGANVICSFTTRKPRVGETEGKEHHFVNVVPDPSELLAYTNFGGHAYYALKTQVYGDCSVYVIDEEGLRNLKAAHGDKYRIFSVYIKRSLKTRWESGVSEGRTKRDECRVPMDISEYDWVIDNNDSEEALLTNIESIYQRVLKAK